MGHGGILQRGKLLSQYMKLELKESFACKGNASSYKSVRQEKAWQTQEMRDIQCVRGSVQGKWLRSGQDTQIQSFVPSAIHLAHTYCLLCVRPCSEPNR